MASLSAANQQLKVSWRLFSISRDALGRNANEAESCYSTAGEAVWSCIGVGS